MAAKLSNIAQFCDDSLFRDREDEDRHEMLLTFLAGEAKEN